MLEAQRDLTRRAHETGGDPGHPDPLGAAANRTLLRQIEHITTQIEAEGLGLAPLIVLSQQIRRLC